MVMELIRATSRKGGFSFYKRDYVITYSALPWRLFGTALFPDEPLLLISEQYIERRERPVNAGNVLLQVYLLLIAQSLMPVDLLFKDPKPVPGHHDLMKEDVDGHFL